MFVSGLSYMSSSTFKVCVLSTVAMLFLCGMCKVEIGTPYEDVDSLVILVVTECVTE